MSEYVKLGVNVDHVATLREARKTHEPDPLLAALLAEQAGADGITVHLRGDRRHIQERDLELLRRSIQTRLNLEMAPTQEMVNIALSIHPDQCTLVPERPNEVTTEGGLDVQFHISVLQPIVERLKLGGIEVSIFVDPDVTQIRACHKIGAQAIEINTNLYATASDEGLRKAEIKKIEECAQLAERMGLRVLAGHALNYHNVQAIVRIKAIEELNIGHAIIARAVFTGIQQAVREMKELLKRD